MTVSLVLQSFKHLLLEFTFPLILFFIVCLDTVIVFAALISSLDDFCAYSVDLFLELWVVVVHSLDLEQSSLVLVGKFLILLVFGFGVLKRCWHFEGFVSLHCQLHISDVLLKTLFLVFKIKDHQRQLFYLYLVRMPV